MPQMETIVKTFAACKIILPRWSGSGCIVGYDTVDGRDGCWVLSNKHVSSEVGTRQKLRFHLPYGADQTFDGVTRYAAYSSRFAIDWALVFVPGLTFEQYGIKPHKMSKTKPATLGTFNQTGSPRGVFPLTSVDFRFRKMVSSDRMALFTPVSISGQSGSALRGERGVVFYLLTWSLRDGGVNYCACQETTDIWTSLSQRSSEVGALRVDGLVEMGGNDRGIKEGFSAPPEEMAIGEIKDLPIWDTGEDPIDPIDPVKPPSPILDVLIERAESNKTAVELELKRLKAIQSNGAVSETDDNLFGMGK